MTSREEIAAALERLETRDREVLDLSLRRRVPDEDLADLYEWQPGQVAARRAAAIERLTSDLDVQRGAELGDVLKSLLDHDTWALVRSSSQPGERAAGHAEPAEAAGGGPRLAAVPAPAPTEPPDTGTLPPQPTPPVPPPPAFEPPPAAEPATEPAAQPAPPAAPEVPSAAVTAGEPPARTPFRAGGLRTAAIVGILAAGVGAAAVAVLDSSSGSSSSDSGSTDGARPFVPAATGKGAAGAQAAPFPTDPNAVPGYPTAYVKHATTLYRKPEGRPLLKIPARTEWGSPRVLGVVRREGSWLAVQAPELRNGQVGWIPDAGAQLDGSAFAVDVDVSRRSVVVRKSGHRLRRFRIAVGQSRHPTPLGRYSVTDKLNVKTKGSPYGCCVVALTGHQTHLPPDWPGGDRLAIHATTDEQSIGRAVSLGCMRTNGRTARWLIKTLPIGTPVFIRS